MKYYVFSDVHGYYSLLKNELDKKGFDINNKNHMLISIGDNFDRGPENYQMYEFLVEMKKLNKIILVKGNHEDLFLRMLYQRKASYVDITNGTYDTLIQFTKKYSNTDPEDQFYMYPDSAFGHSPGRSTPSFARCITPSSHFPWCTFFSADRRRRRCRRPGSAGQWRGCRRLPEFSGTLPQPPWSWASEDFPPHGSEESD